MTYLMMTSSGDPRPLTDPARAGETFDETANEFVSHGGCGQSLWFGPAVDDFKAEMRVDVDVEADRALVTWLADDTIAVELAPGPSLPIEWSIDAATVTVPGNLARVSAATARRAIEEYVTTGDRPRSLTWVAEPGAADLPQAVNGF